MGKLREEDGFHSHGQQESTLVLNSSSLVRSHTHHALRPRCQFFSRCWPQPTPRTQVGMSFIYCCVCMSMRFMMCVRSMPVLQRCVEVRGQLSKSVLPYSPYKLGALGWRPGNFGSDLLFLPPGITDAHCCLWLFFHKSSCDWTWTQGFHGKCFYLPIRLSDLRFISDVISRRLQKR